MKLRFAPLTGLVLAGLFGCSNPNSKEGGEHRGEHSREGRGEHSREGRGEHGREGREGGGEHGGERGGEESGQQFARNATYDKVRHGVRLKLAYDAASNSFRGTVKNTTEKSIERVRVEVHLSNGKELGPTKPGALGPGEERKVVLAATSREFKRWSAHPEVGNSEHAHERGEGRGEHGGERRGEHK